MKKPLERIAVNVLTGIFLLVVFMSRAHAQGSTAAYTYVAAGSDFTFALQSNGTLWAWGSNSSGQLGDGTTITRLQPVAIAEPVGATPGSRWVRLFARGSQSSVFGLRSDQTLWRWGNNQTRPTQVPLSASLSSGATLTDLAVGAEYFLALYSDGALLSWGSNSQGQLGLGATAGTGVVPTPTPVLTPSAAGTGTRWTAIEAESNASFAVRSDGTLWSWGGVAVTNPSALGHPVTATGCFAPELVPHPATAAPGTGWVSVEAGETHTLGLRTDGTLWAWGYSNYGAMGQGVGNTSSTAPLPIALPAGRPTGTTWQRVQAGSHTSQGILSDGTLWAWGYNAFGQLGVNSNNALETVPQQEYNQEQWTQSALGLNHAVALSRGRVYVTGNGSNGSLGLGNATSRLYFFVRVVGLPLPTFAAQNNDLITQIAPNPASPGDILSVVLPSALSNRAEFRNALGQVVGQSVVFNNRLSAPLLVPGVYVVRFYNKELFLGFSKFNIN